MKMPIHTTMRHIADQLIQDFTADQAWSALIDDTNLNDDQYIPLVETLVITTAHLVLKTKALVQFPPL